MYITIAEVTFNGIYWTHYLLPQTIITVLCPTQANHSIKQILCLEYKARKQGQVFTMIETKHPWMDSAIKQRLSFSFMGVTGMVPHRVLKKVNKAGKAVASAINFTQLYSNTLIIIMTDELHEKQGKHC